MSLELVDIWSLSDDSDTALAFPLVPAEVGAVEIDEADSAFPASPAVWLLAWSLRRQTWRELIAKGQLEITFHHDAESGEGSATLRFMSDSGAGVTMEAPDFERSDAPCTWNIPTILDCFSGLSIASSMSNTWTMMIRICMSIPLHQ